MLKEEFGSDMAQTALEIHLKRYCILDFGRNKITAHNKRSRHNIMKYTLNSWILIGYIFYGMLLVGYVILYNILSKVSRNILLPFL